MVITDPEQNKWYADVFRLAGTDLTPDELAPYLEPYRRNGYSPEAGARILHQRLKFQYEKN